MWSKQTARKGLRNEEVTQTLMLYFIEILFIKIAVNKNVFIALSYCQAGTDEPAEIIFLKSTAEFNQLPITIRTIEAG
jgi:hypothetical protein